MKIYIAFFLSLCLFLGGCGSSAGSSSMPQKPQKVIQLALSEKTDPRTIQAMATFVEQVASISSGSMKVELVNNETPLDLLWDKKDVGLALISNQEAARADENYNIFTLPFFFRDYRQMTMTANSELFARLVAERQRPFEEAIPLGAFYGGSRAFVSIGNYLSVVTDFDKIHIYSNQSGNVMPILSKMGAKVHADTFENISSAFAQGKITAIECGFSDILALTMPINKQEIILTKSFHSTKLNWLMVGPYADVNDDQMAVLKEAFAYAVVKNDQAILKDEAEVDDYIEFLGGHQVDIDYHGFVSETEKILKSKGLFSNIDYETYLSLRSMPG